MHKSKMSGLAQKTFSTKTELRLHEGYYSIHTQLERKRRATDPTFQDVDAEGFTPVSYMFKQMPEFQKETYSTR